MQLLTVVKNHHLHVYRTPSHLKSRQQRQTFDAHITQTLTFYVVLFPIMVKRVSLIVLLCVNYYRHALTHCYVWREYV